MPLPESLPTVDSIIAFSVACGFAVTVLMNNSPLRAAETNELTGALDHIRDAVGYRAFHQRTEGVLVEGVAEYQGMRGPYTLRFAPGGKFLRRVQLRWDQVVGCDGQTTWQVDWSRTPHVLELEDLEFEQLVFGVLTNRWLEEGGPFQVSLAAAKNPQELVFHLQLRGGVERVELRVSRSTWLPLRLTAQRLGTDETWEFDDYRPAAGLMLPYRTVHRMGGLSDQFKIRDVRVTPTTTEMFKPALEPPRDTHFQKTGDAHFEVKQAASGHLFVRPKIGGQEVGWFALDTGTGAGMTIAPAVAERLGMPAFGRVVQGGAGKLGTGRFREGKRFELGSMTIDDSVYLELPQAFCDSMKKLFGFEFAGTCGYDVFSRAVVELDLKCSTAACYEATNYRLTRGRWEDLHLNRKIPCVHVEFEGDRKDLFQFDTGAGANILFHAPAVAKFKLLAKRRTTPIKVGGVGGASGAQYGALDWFQVGPRRIKNPAAIFLAPHEGALNMPHVAGTFGAGILKGMTIVFDYPHRRIAFVDGNAS